MTSITQRIKRLIRSKPEVWHLTQEKSGDAICCVMDSKDFDERVKDQPGCTIPVIDSSAYTYIATPAYPIIVRRRDRVPKDWKP